MDARFSRNEIIYGSAACSRIAKASVAICGVGAVGSFAAEALARLGVGNFFLFDPDSVEISNINRQLCALDSTVGKLKVDVVKSRLLDINPNARVEASAEFISSDNMGEIFRCNPSVVVDAADSLAAKCDLLCACVNNKIRVVSSMGAARRKDTEKVFKADIFSTSVCPLAARIRKELRSRGVREKIPCVFSTEEPANGTHLGGGDSRKVLGSAVQVAGIFGLKLADLALGEILTEKVCDNPL